MKKLIISLLFAFTGLVCYSQDIYLVGEIKQFDIFLIDYDFNRTVDWIKAKGHVVFDKDELIVHSRRRLKDYVHNYAIQDITEIENNEDSIKYKFVLIKYLNCEHKTSYITIWSDGTWMLELNYCEQNEDEMSRRRTYYRGYTFKEVLFEKRRRF